MPVEVCFSETSSKHVSPLCAVSLTHVFCCVLEAILMSYRKTTVLLYKKITVHCVPLASLDVGCTNSGICFALEMHVKVFLLRS